MVLNLYKTKQTQLLVGTLIWTEDIQKKSYQSKWTIPHKSLIRQHLPNIAVGWRTDFIYIIFLPWMLWWFVWYDPQFPPQILSQQKCLRMSSPQSLGSTAHICTETEINTMYNRIANQKINYKQHSSQSEDQLQTTF